MTTEKKIQLGSGKSLLAKHLISKTNRLVIYDIMSEYIDGVTFDDTIRSGLVEFWRQVYQGDFRIIYRPLNPKREIDWLAEAVFALGNLLSRKSTQSARRLTCPGQSKR